MVPALAPAPAADTAFFITFGIFVLALLILAFLTLRWAIRQDRANFSAWRQRQRQRAFPTAAPATPTAPTATATTTPTPTPIPAPAPDPDRPGAGDDGPSHPVR